MMMATLVGGPRHGETREVTAADLYILVPGPPEPASADRRTFYLPDMHRYRRSEELDLFAYEGIDHLTPRE